MDIREWLGEENKIGIDIWEKKYRYKNETFDEWLDRVSGGNKEIRQLIVEKKFLFGGRILSNRGLNKIDGKKITYSNCYVIPPANDDLESIFDSASKLARTFSYGGGVGIDIGKLRPNKARVNNAAKESTGAVSFMDLYSEITGTISQNGRRGALMISIPCDHPDLEEFIDIKTDLNRVTKANISIRITDNFMKAVKEKSTYKLSFTVESTGEVIEKEVNAYDIFKKICKNNWDYAEPGALFWDRIENWNLLSNNEEFSYAGVNPCAEEPLPAFGSCLLSSINLSEFVIKPFTDKATFDYKEFKRTVHAGIIALNEVLDEGLPLHPLKEQRDCVRDWRQVGLGILGLGDMLIKMGIRYGSKESIELCDWIASEMIDTAIRTSAKLSRDTKTTYPKFNEDVLWSNFFIANTKEKTKELVKEYGLKNSQLLTIAPTGSLSTMLGVTGGIEPIFTNSYTRKTESLHGKDKYYKVCTPIVKEYMENNNLNDESKLPDYFVTAQNLDYRERIDMQAVWQKHIDASISSTVNLPNEATVDDVVNLYTYAWEKGLKGITIFRDGCKRVGILTIEDKNNKENNENGTELSNTLENIPRGCIIKVDDNTVGKERHLITGCGSLHCQAFFDPDTGELLETYLSKGSTGGCQSNLAAISRLMSLCARGGINVHDIVDQLDSCMACPSYAVRRATKHDTSRGSCCPNAIGNALLDMYDEMRWELGLDEEYDNDKRVIIKTNETNTTNTKTDSSNKNNNFVPCPQCNEPLTFEGGCNICKSCGWSKCD